MLVSEVTAFLEQAYNVLNQHYFGGILPPVIITVQSSPKTNGHYTKFDAWEQSNQGYREINISAENLNRPIQCVIATLIHEMVHHFCDQQGIKDCSRGGVYHNKKFKEQAQQRDLIIEYNPRIGFSVTSPSYALVAFIEGQGWQGIDLSRVGGHSVPGGGSDNAGNSGGDNGKPKSSTRKYQCRVCQNSVRATKEVHIACLDCNTQMFQVEK
ncbi:SprT-like domain-containing protein [Sedimentibacter hydroxybenzoicus DSM 7310]|uniref:SprT-like domain-containing protein n=1 Tax=Sedimentibacter hydroxybenzoicus DSM 7310 TaxID=1123245 RepID=A0A974BID8_SEDHY|nr:SprT-like domain-containing protein [Sedimentibacter hydroxybenzoicus]NYB73770.1 SprT-like domain-containing protein [Sedimentibacter hydroxybenzoicus DSM 7310]